MDKVWVCESGMLYEGGGVRCVVATERLALAWLQRRRAESIKEMGRLQEVEEGEAKRHGYPAPETDRWETYDIYRIKEDGWCFQDSTNYYTVRPIAVLTELPEDTTQ